MKRSLLVPGAVHRARPRQRGQTMLLVVMLSSVTLGLTAVAFRTTDDAISTEDFQRQRDFRDEVISGALGRGVEMLRTGDPPKNPYHYVEVATLADGSKFYTLVVFERQQNGGGLPAGDESYVVTASPGTQSDLIRYGPPPDEFHGNGGNSGGNGNGGGGDDGDDDDDDGDDDDGDDGKNGCGDRGKEKGRGLGWGVGGIPPGSDEGGKNGWNGGDKPPGDPGPEKNDGNQGQSGKNDGKGGGGKKDS